MGVLDCTVQVGEQDTTCVIIYILNGRALTSAIAYWYTYGTEPSSLLLARHVHLLI